MIASTTSEWATAIATFAAVVVALWVAHRESRWRRAADRREAFSHASHVRILDYIVGGLGHFRVHNGSKIRIRDIVVTGVFANNVGVRADPIRRLDPGLEADATILAADHQPPDLPPVEQDGIVQLHAFQTATIEFRSETGHQWVIVDDETWLRFGWWRLQWWRRSDDVLRWSDPAAHIVCKPKSAPASSRSS